MKQFCLLLLGTIFLLVACNGDVLQSPTFPQSVPTPFPPGPLPSAHPSTDRPPSALVSLSPRPAGRTVTGVAPLVLTASLCDSTDPDGDQISFRYVWGDGLDHSSFACRASHTYGAGRYDATFCVYDRTEFLFTCKGFVVVVTN